MKSISTDVLFTVIEVLVTNHIDDEEIEAQVERLLEPETLLPIEAMALPLARKH